MDVIFNNIMLEDLLICFFIYMELILMKNTCRNIDTVCKIQNGMRSYDMTWYTSIYFWIVSYITGNKMNNIDVVYTMWANLKKTQGMDVGQVGFFKDKEVTLHNFIRY